MKHPDFSKKVLGSIAAWVGPDHELVNQVYGQRVRALVASIYRELYGAGGSGEGRYLVFTEEPDGAMLTKQDRPTIDAARLLATTMVGMDHRVVVFDTTERMNVITLEPLRGARKVPLTPRRYGGTHGA